MRLKSFYAKTMTEAMEMVRDALGEDAVIVATKEEPGGKTIHVTAAIDPDSYDDHMHEEDEALFEEAHEQMEHDTAGYDDRDIHTNWLQYDEERDMSAVEEEITDVLLRHNVPENVMDHILSCVGIVNFNQPSKALIAALEHLFNFRPLQSRPYKKGLMLIGPPGSGKSLGVSKLAARAVMNGLKTAVITTDTVRAGALEQLEAFTGVMNVPLMKAESPKDLKYLLADLERVDQVLIDTAGINPFDKEDIKILAKFIGAAEIDPIATIPAGVDTEEAAETARVFATIGAKTIIPTRLDIARRLGGVIAASYNGGLAFAGASNTAKVADGFTTLSPESLARMLMPKAFKLDTENIGQPTKKKEPLRARPSSGKIKQKVRS